MIGKIDIERAIVALWDTAGIDDFFEEDWTTTEQSEFFPLNSDEAPPKTPFPFCVFVVSQPLTTGRSSGPGATFREYRETPLEFSVQAKDRGTMPAKLTAGILAEKIMSVFGGHPEDAPQSMELTHGGVLLCQYQNDHGMKTSESEYQWLVNYKIVSDIPVKA